MCVCVYECIYNYILVQCKHGTFVASIISWFKSQTSKNSEVLKKSEILTLYTIFCSPRAESLVRQLQRVVSEMHSSARWAPTSYKWSYNHYKWPYNWVYNWGYNPTYRGYNLVTGRGPSWWIDLFSPVWIEIMLGGFAILNSRSWDQNPMSSRPKGVKEHTGNALDRVGKLKTTRLSFPRPVYVSNLRGV